MSQVGFIDSSRTGGPTRAEGGGLERGRQRATSSWCYCPPSVHPRLSLLLAPAFLLAACADVTRFSTKPGEAYCGSVIAGPFVRSGFGPGVRMRMSFDADRMNSSPGSLSTDDGLLTDAPMRPIPQLSHDPLSTLQFGEQRDKNLVYVVTPTKPSSGPSLLAVVSLLHDGGAEVRLLRGAPPLPGTTAIADTEGESIFGVFPLQRESGTCGF